MTRHLGYEPGPIPTFWKSEMALGKITELEYYKHIYPRNMIKDFIRKLKALPMEIVVWDSEDTLHIERGIVLNKATSGITFIPDITRLRIEYEEKIGL